MENKINPKQVLSRSSGMPDNRISFYRKTVEEWITDKESSILVVGGGETDWDVFHNLGFKHVILSNIDSRLKGDEFAPYQWSFQKAEELNYGVAEFDFVVVHAALHHCESPHRALLEMYRVAKIGAICFESRDSLLMKFLEKFGFTSSYEHLAVYYNEGKFGGLNNTEIPNYIYRWTEREIEKTVNTYAPSVKHQFKYQYGNDTPASTSLENQAKLKTIIIFLLNPLYQLFAILFPKQQNLFAFYISKPNTNQDIHEWLKIEKGEVKFNYEWAKNMYK